MNENTESREIDLLQMASALVKKWWVIAVATVLAGIIAFGYTRLGITPKYEATAMFYVNNSSISAVTGKFTFSASELAAAQTLADTYRVILGTRLNLEEVIREGNFNYTYEQLNKMIGSQAVNGTEIFSVTVTSSDPQEACDIANTIASVLPQKVADVMEGAKVKVVDYAVVPQTKSSPSTPKNTVLGMLVGFVLSAGVIILLEIFNDTINSEEWLVTTYGDEIPLLSVVPDVNAKSDRRYYKYGGYYGTATKNGENSN